MVSRGVVSLFFQSCFAAAAAAAAARGVWPTGGPGAAIATLNGTKTSSVGFDDCIFNTWDAQPNATRAPAAISNLGPGSLMVRGCEFQSSHRGGQCLLAQGSGKAIVTNNLVAGALNVTDLGARVSIVRDNAAG
jgi:hypothetical protein